MSFLEYLALIYIGGPRNLTAKTTLMKGMTFRSRSKTSSLRPVKVALIETRPFLDMEYKK